MGKTKDISSLDVAQKSIIKKYGNILTSMSDADTEIKTLSTGLLSVDLALGRGGMAEGRIAEIYGPPSGGKTTLCMRMIAQAQEVAKNKNTGKKCVFVDAERAADPMLFQAMGVDIDDLLLIKAFTGDENLDALETLIKTGEVSLAVVDSVTALIPKEEAEEEVGKNFMALLARLMSKALRRFVPLAASTGCTILFINQIRHDITKWGDSEVTSGGDATNFYSTYRIRVSGGDTKSSRIVDKESGEVAGHKTTFKVVKNKLAAPHRTAEVDLIYGTGYDIYKEVTTLAVDLGIIDQKGAFYYLNGDKIAQGAENLKLALIKDNDLYDNIYKSVIEITGLSEYYGK